MPASTPRSPNWSGAATPASMPAGRVTTRPPRPPRSPPPSTSATAAPAGEMDLAVVLRDRFPTVAALFLAGELNARRVLADRQPHLPGHQPRRGRHPRSGHRRADHRVGAADRGQTHPGHRRLGRQGSTPPRCGAPAPAPAAATSPSPTPMPPAPPRCTAGCWAPTPSCSNSGWRRWPAGCARTTPAPWPNAAPTRWARWARAPRCCPVRVPTRTARPSSTTAGPAASSCT